MKNNSNILFTKEELLVVKDNFRDWIVMINISSNSKEEAESLKQQILDNQEIVQRLQETINWIDSNLGYLSANDKERYVDFEWLKSHLLSIKNNENRSELRPILEKQA